jgi:hypothetical protein
MFRVYFLLYFRFIPSDKDTHTRMNTGGWTGSGAYTTMSATLTPGYNVLLVEASNGGGPAGLLVGVYLSGNLLFQTGVCLCVFIDVVVLFSPQSPILPFL